MRGISISESRKSQSLRYKYSVPKVIGGGGGGRAAESRADGSRASAMTNRTGAENNSKEINMATKKNRVLIHLGIANSSFFDFRSSFRNPISLFNFLPLLQITACFESGNLVNRRENGFEDLTELQVKMYEFEDQEMKSVLVKQGRLILSMLWFIQFITPSLDMLSFLTRLGVISF